MIQMFVVNIGFSWGFVLTISGIYTCIFSCYNMAVHLMTRFRIMALRICIGMAFMPSFHKTFHH